MINKLRENLLQTLTQNNADLIDYFVNRLTDNNYRGNHISQHNRFDRKKVECILDELSKKGKIEILQGDDKGNYPQSVSEYINFVENINKKIGNGTPNSIKKNLFPDFHRMGLIKRYDKNQNETNAYRTKSVKYVEISELGKKLIDSKTEQKHKNFIFMQAINRLSNGLIKNTNNILTSLQNEKTNYSNYLETTEIMFFITGINQKFNNKRYYYDDILLFVEKWKNFNLKRKQKLINTIKEWCKDAHIKATNKKNDRDWNNWRNEAQQIMNLFSQTLSFEKNKDRLYLRFGKNSMFQNLNEAKRSNIEKQKYFKNHHLQKTPGYVLHHIIPLNQAKDLNEWFLLDRWENMLYIDATSHSIIHSYDEFKLFELKYNRKSEEIFFISIFKEDKTVSCNKNTQVKFSENLIGELLKWNYNVLNDNFNNLLKK